MGQKAVSQRKIREAAHSGVGGAYNWPAEAEGKESSLSFL